MIDTHSTWQDVEAIRRQAPLVHNITNFVVMNNTANALLALGASPVMAHAPEEMDEITAIAGALVINIGTLRTPWITSMYQAAKAARQRGIPVVLDPVGAGASKLRTGTAHALLDTGAVTILRGNAAEIRALFDEEARTKGVDSDIAPDAVADTARALAAKYACAVVVSGETDLVLDATRELRVRNGHAMMTRVTGLGCTASAITGAFAAVNPDPVIAAAHAMVVMGICGELAAEGAPGPGTLQLNLLDRFYQLSREDLADRFKVEMGTR